MATPKSSSASRPKAGSSTSKASTVTSANARPPEQLEETTQTPRSNTWLWDQVEQTPPSITKDFQRKGGFKGTAINPTAQFKRATEIFGPVGAGWGWTVLNERYLDIGATQEVVHVVRLGFWWTDGSTRHAMEVYGQTMMVEKRKDYFFVDEEAPKKSLTDALTKALSMLGFSADIHMGRWDDSKYVDERREEEAEEQRQVAKKKEPPKSEKLKTAEASGKQPEIFQARLEEIHCQPIMSLAESRRYVDLIVQMESWVETEGELEQLQDCVRAPLSEIGPKVRQPAIDVIKKLGEKLKS